MKKIIYVGNFSFPFGNASGKRVYGNGKLFEKMGYDVLFIGMDKEVKQSSSLKETEKQYQNFKYYNLSYPKGSLDWLSYQATVTKVIDFIEEEKLKESLEAVIYYGNPRLSLFNYLLIKWCKKNDVKVISDCVDWLDSRTGNILFDTIKWADTTYQKAYLNKKVDGVIAISSYLEDYYKRYNISTIIIPPLSTSQLCEKKYVEKEDQKLKIIYAGLPFRKGAIIENATILKDRIDKAIVLLSKIKEKNYDFIFDVYGFTKEEYLKVLPSQEEFIKILADSIEFHGYQNNEIVVERLKESDFTILLRDVKKDTMAGFPTKVSESMSFGVPVITTKTSDLEDYIDDGINGFFLDINDEDKAVEKIEKIFQSSKVDILAMKNICIKENKFFFKHYEVKTKQFFNTLNHSVKKDI